MKNYNHEYKKNKHEWIIIDKPWRILNIYLYFNIANERGIWKIRLKNKTVTN